jgi:polysaccharide biosynthesis protein PslH
MKLMVLLSRIPWPTEKGDKLRAFHQIRCLAEKHEITLVALSEEDTPPEAEKILRQYCRHMYFFRLKKPGMILNLFFTLFSGKPFQTGYFYRRQIRKKILSIAADLQPDHVYCQLIRMAEYAGCLPYPKSLDYQDVLSTGMKRRLQKASAWMKPIFYLEYKRLLRYEKYVFDRFDHKTIISQPDRDLIPHSSRNLIHIIPNGVDYDFFYPRDRDKTFDIVFTGNMAYPPNVDAAEYLARSVMPIILTQRPGTTLLIAGATPHSRVKALASNNITISGWMDDIRDSYASSKVFVAPMQIGTGLQNKLLEAMAMKIPCVTSPLANNALRAEEGKDILVAGTPPEFAAQVLRLLNDQAYAGSIAANGYHFVRRTYDWHAASALLEQLFISTPNKITGTQTN